MEVYQTDDMAWKPVVENSRTGLIERKYIREAELLPGMGYTADVYHYMASETDFHTPRHHHNFDQIRYCISGEMDFGRGNRTKAGDIAYFPAGAFYGPQRIHEASILLIQWSQGWVTRAAHDQAMQEMREIGEFKDGYFTYTDDRGRSRRKDSINAIWEHALKRPFRIPIPRYTGPITMNPDAYTWPNERDGLQYKQLGRFTEHDLSIYQVRWVKGGAVQTLDVGRTQCLFTLSGQISMSGRSYESHTMLWSDFDESVAVEAAEGTEAIYIGFPGATASQTVA
jgi:mannose-6-phosphate isomerase-like protein (cupin superfamily)